MVSRRSTQSITQRSTRQSELHMARRPRRLVPPKTMDDTVGLSRKEERELKKALYASLQMTRRNRNPQSEAEDSNISEEPPSKLRKSTRNISANSSYLSASSSYASLKETMTTSQSAVDESSQDSVMSSAGSACESKKKIHAQRKFAQGCSLPSTPSTTPNKKAPNSPHNLLNRVPKTEDFLTFLCLRGSHILPPHLDFFNFSRDGAPVEESSSNPRTPVSADQPIKTEEAREGTPESSSSSSNTNEELREISNFALAQRKAARASAGTPETARGIVSLRQGLTRKVAHSGGTPPSQHSKQYFFDPEKTPSPTGSRLLLGDITPAKKSASIKCLPSSFLRFSPLGKLVLERQGNQPLIMSKCSLQPSPLSIDKAQAQAKRLAQDSKIAEPVEAMVDFEIPFKGGNSDIAELSDTLVNQEMPFKTIDSKVGKPSQDSGDYETSIKPTWGTSDFEKSLDAMAKSEMPFEMISATKLQKSLVNQEEFCKVALENLDSEKLFETFGNLEMPLEAKWEHSDTDNAATCVKPFLVINESINNVATCVKPFTVTYKSTDNVATCVKPTAIPESTDIANRTEPLTTYEQNFEVAFKNSDDAKISETISNHVILLTVNHGHSDIIHEPVANHKISLNTRCCISDIVNKSTLRHEVLIVGKHDNSDVDEFMAIQEAPLNTHCSSSEIIDEFTTSHEIPLTIQQGSSGSANELSLTIQQGISDIADEISLIIKQGSVGIANEIPLTIQQGSIGIADEIPLTIQQGSSNIANEIPLTIQQGSSDIADEISLTTQQGSSDIANEIPLTIQQGSSDTADEIPLTIQQRISSIANESMIKLEISLSVKHASLDSVDYSAASHKIPLSIKPDNSDNADEIMSNHDILLNVKHNSLHIAKETTHEIYLKAKHSSSDHENPVNVRKSLDSANQSLVASHKLQSDVNENSDNVKPAESMTYYERKDFLDRSDNVKPAETMTKYEMKERLDIMGIANQSEIMANFEMKNLLDDSDIEKQSEIMANCEMKYLLDYLGSVKPAETLNNFEMKDLLDNSDIAKLSESTTVLGKILEKFLSNFETRNLDQDKWSLTLPSSCTSSQTISHCKESALLKSSYSATRNKGVYCISDLSSGHKTAQTMTHSCNSAPSLAMPGVELKLQHKYSEQEPSHIDECFCLLDLDTFPSASPDHNYLEEASCGTDHSESGSLLSSMIAPVSKLKSVSGKDLQGFDSEWYLNRKIVAAHNTQVKSNIVAACNTQMMQSEKNDVAFGGVIRDPFAYPGIFSLNTVSTTKESDDLVTAVERDNLLIVDTALENNLLIVDTAVENNLLIVDTAVENDNLLIVDTALENDNLLIVDTAVENDDNLLIVDTAVENDNLLAGITSSNTASDITYASPDMSKWNLEHSKIQDYKVLAGTLPRSQTKTSFVAARPSYVPLPCPPLSSFRDFQARHSDSNRSTTYPEFENVSRYWRPCQNTVSLTSLLGSHCIYRSHPLSCHEDQTVQACMCGNCRFEVDRYPTLSVLDQTYPDFTSPETGLITSSLSSHLYPLPPAIMSFSFFKRSATEMAKSSKQDPANHKKEIQTANDISVRRTLELASKKLTRKDENLELASKKLRRKDESVVSKNTSKKDINLKSRHPGNFKNHSSKQKARRKAEQQKKLKVSREKDRKNKQEKRKVTSAHKHKRRTSLRLKTLAKILGKKRPNYSLVLSGYADMEEYEEEQKKKAAKSALAKARAEARAKVSMKNQEFHTDKMLTRSSAHSAVKVAVIKKTLSLKTDIVPIVNKDQSTLASIIETKRVKKEGGKDMDKEDQSTPHTSEKGEGKSHAAKPTQQKKVSPKKSTPEKSSLGLSQMPDPSLSGLVVVPTFYPTEEEFSDPIAYISSIKDKAEPFGMCRIIPPPVWKMESKLNEEIRFTTQIQHLHRLFNRWGPSVELSRAISLHLRDVIRDPNCLPQIGGVEVDLPQLYSMIRVLGGLQNIVDKKQWVRVADAMKIPKAAHDRVTRLYDIYCKYVLPYAMVTEAERQQAQKDVHDSYDLSSAEEEAILKGKSMTLSAFSRIARNVQSMWFKDDPSPELVEAAYWKIVKERDSHVAVQCAHVNTRAQATGFPTRRESPYFRHSWNLNNLPDNKKCILKCLGPVSGTTIPTLHVGMLFSTSCWSTDPHRLPYVQYLHSGANTIWYCIPKSHVSGFHNAMKELCPTLLHNDPRWLKEDIAMVKPDELMARGVNVMCCIQQPRQFVVVFPDAYTATVCCGYSVSESVHYATADWLSISVDAAKDLCASGEKEMFSVDTLVCNLCQDSSDPEILAAALPLLESIVAREVEERHELSAAGLKCERRLAVEDGPGTSSLLARKRSHDLTEDSICEVCCKICYLSMVLNEHDEQILCLEHGLRYVQRKRHTKAAKLFYRYTEEELAELVLETKDRLATLSNGSNSIKKRSLKKQDSRS